ncbi:S8 family peptidase [Amycolatopsis nigrescens]|uniref:S8 family peptidase n=1 Tax=Amycolatopsis nigrescens TaxID=381445 RepID=UPI0004777EAE|nr:S8 family peptidase [Amycolatopsis nigrescens]
MRVSRARLWPKGLAAAVVAVPLALGGVQTAQAVQGPPAPGPDRVESVTLLTGDRVFLDEGRPTGKLLPGPGRERIGFSTFQAGGHNYVVPTDAAALVNSGALDPRLFDVNALLASGYGDAQRNTLPLMVTYTGQAPRALTTSGATVTRELPSIGGAAVRAEKAAATGFWAGITGRSGNMTTLGSGIKKVWLDGVRRAALDKSVPQIGAPAAWEAGYTGEGVKVAVLDTGVDQTHPDLADRETAEQNFSDAADSVDHFGHGTHVASTIAGTGAKSGGKYRGVAYDAQLIDGKVLNDGGSGAESWIIAGLQWAAEQGADIANLSLGGGDTPELDPLEEAVNELSAEHGTLFVIAAGNSGPSKGSVGSPGSADAALTVGAVDRDNAIAPFSSRGPRVGDGAIKPDITAPGVGIVAALHSDGVIGPPVEEGYTALSGTSMATPHVAGAAALLAQQHPDLTGQQLKGLLTASAKPTDGLTPFDQGSGRVDSAKALTQTLTSAPNSLGFGVQQWPHDDDQPVTKEVSYTNSGTEPVELNLELAATGPDGAPAPAGVFAVSPSKLTVPAGGKASAKVVGDTKTAPLDGTYSGTLIASAGDAAVRTPVAIDREVESYDLDLNLLDRAGAATGNGLITLANIDTGEGFRPTAPDGHSTVRLPKGRYLLQGIVISGTNENPSFDLLNYPALTVGGDLTVDLDGRLTKPVLVSPPNKAAQLSIADVSIKRSSGEKSFAIGFALLGGGRTDMIGTAHLGPDLPPAELVSQVNTQWSVADPAESYGLAWYSYGRSPTGFSKDVQPSEVAKVHAAFGPTRPNLTGYSGASPSPHLQQGFGWASLNEVAMPGERTEFYNGDSADWKRMLMVQKAGTFELDSNLESAPKSYQAGREYSEAFNRPVFGPVLPRTGMPGEWVYRDKDRINVATPLFGDGNGNSGSSVVDTAYTRLYRNGELVGETDSAGGGRFDVPPEAAGYRLVTEAARSNSDLSTRVNAAWTFNSGSTTAITALPLSTVRYFPALDGNGAAPGGGPFTVPVAVQEQGSDVTKVPYKLTAEASYDGGQTWTPATIIGNAQLVLQHPPGGGTVSLRAKATDGNGNTVEQTVVHAYRLK